MGLANDIAANFKIPLPLGELAEGVYADVIKQDPDLARKDFSSVYRYLRTASLEGRKVPLTEHVST
jgi:3-hydroxyisobutyrate dehydrogenase